MDDLRILLDIGCGRCDLHELHDILRGALLIIDTALAHFIQHRNRIDHLRIAEHLIDRLIDLAVGFQIKILRTHHADHIVDTAAVDQQGAENGLLRLQRMGRLTA